MKTGSLLSVLGGDSKGMLMLRERCALSGRGSFVRSAFEGGQCFHCSLRIPSARRQTARDSPLVASLAAGVSPGTSQSRCSSARVFRSGLLEFWLHFHPTRCSQAGQSVGRRCNKPGPVRSSARATAFRFALRSDCSPGTWSKRREHRGQQSRPVSHTTRSAALSCAPRSRRGSRIRPHHSLAISSRYI